MKTAIQTITLAETAFLLRAKLGPLRAWADFLADNIRGRQNLRGLTLLPCAKKKDGRTYRPVYAVKDVEKFIDEVLAVEPKAGKLPIVPVILNVDTGRTWRINKFERDGSAVVTRRRVFNYASHG